MTEPIEDIIEISEIRYKDALLNAAKNYHDLYTELCQTLIEMERKKDEGQIVKFYLNNKTGEAYYEAKEKEKIGYR